MAVHSLQFEDDGADEIDAHGHIGKNLEGKAELQIIHTDAANNPSSKAHHDAQAVAPPHLSYPLPYGTPQLAFIDFDLPVQTFLQGKELFTEFIKFMTRNIGSFHNVLIVFND